MKRRDFLFATSALFVGLESSAANAQGAVMTVTGGVTPNKMGVTLTHEHVLVDFIGADKVSPSRYNADDAFKVILPYLQQIKGLGCQTFVECTPACIGRDVKLLQRLSIASGLQILTNTGYYGAANDKFVPKHAYSETAQQLAARWLKEWNEGIEGTGVKPGFIKTGVDSGRLSEIDSKLVRAAALTSKQSGLTIASHTGDTQSGVEQLAIVEKEGIPLSRFIWVHAQNDWNLNERVKAAAKGAWISIDNIGPKNIGSTVEKIISMKAANQLHKVLLSHDAGWYSPGEPNGGSFRAYDALFTTLVPALKNTGLTQNEIDRLLIVNPKNAFVIGRQQ